MTRVLRVVRWWAENVGTADNTGRVPMEQIFQLAVITLLISMVTVSAAALYFGRE